MARLDEAVLRRVAEEHVGYEVRHLGTFSGAGGLPRPLDLAVGTAFLEAYLLHARNMWEFLVDKPTAAEDDGVYAVDYFDERPGKRSAWKPWSRTDQQRLHKRLGHITIQRLSSTDWKLRPTDVDRSGWGVAVLDGMDAFVARLAEAHPDRAAWFDCALAAARRELSLSLADRYAFTRVRLRAADGAWEIDR